jgi:hypothetical protein
LVLRRGFAQGSALCRNGEDWDKRIAITEHQAPLNSVNRTAAVTLLIKLEALKTIYGVAGLFQLQIVTNRYAIERLRVTALSRIRFCYQSTMEI